MKERIDAILRRTQAQYLETLLPARDPLLAEMEHHAAEHGHPIADPEVAQFLRALVRMKTPRRVLEIGTNIGYSVVVIGRECGSESVVESIEIDPAILATARSFISRASVPCRVVLHEGAALDVLPRLTGPFDFVFVDCVKEEYTAYLEAVLPKMERGAVIVCDNVLWKGQVADGADDPRTSALRAFNERVAADPRLVTIVLPLGDGTSVSVLL